MTEGIKWTLAGVIAILISVLGALIVLKFGTRLTDEELKWIIPVYISVLIVLWIGFVKSVDTTEKKRREKYDEDMNNKADRTLTDSRFKEHEIVMLDHKETNEAQINAIHEFMASIDHKMEGFDSKLDSLTSFLLNKKR
jgi:low affinity Fe/Cu permease